jgi:hypothetical protein
MAERMNYQSFPMEDRTWEVGATSGGPYCTSHTLQCLQMLTFARAPTFRLRLTVQIHTLHSGQARKQELRSFRPGEGLPFGLSICRQAPVWPGEAGKSARVRRKRRRVDATPNRCCACTLRCFKLPITHQTPKPYTHADLAPPPVAKASTLGTLACRAFRMQTLRSARVWGPRAD